MAKELPYFKFEPSEWMFGRIQKCSGDAVKVFTNLCCKYWHELGELKLEDCRLDFPESEMESLIKNKIVKVEGEYIRINFLDRQFDEIRNFSNLQSVRGKKSAEKRANHRSTTVQPPFNQNPTLVESGSTEPQPIRREEIIGDEMRLDNTGESHLKRFLESQTDQEAMAKYVSGLGKKISAPRILELAGSHDIAHSEKHPGSNYSKWKEYFRYFIRDHREPYTKPDTKPITPDKPIGKIKF